MNRNTVIFVLAVLVILVVLGGYLVARNNNVGNTATTTPSTPTTTTTPQSNQPSSTATQSVSIKNMAFTPASITIKKGTAVTWTNNDSVAHNVVETDGQPGPDSTVVQPGSTYTFTYATAGTYHYHCSIHPNMTGTVVVTE